MISAGLQEISEKLALKKFYLVTNATEMVLVSELSGYIMILLGVNVMIWTIMGKCKSSK